MLPTDGKRRTLWPLIPLACGVAAVLAYGHLCLAAPGGRLRPKDHRAAFASDEAAVRRRLSSVGRPLPGVEIEIRDPDGKPVGVPVNKMGRRARSEAHAAFDVIWNTGTVTRAQAYRWLSNYLQIPKIHIGELSEVECTLVIRASTELIGLIGSGEIIE